MILSAMMVSLQSASTNLILHGEWVKVGDLPTPRSSCTCAIITDREILVAGGHSQPGSSETLHLALIPT